MSKLFDRLIEMRGIDADFLNPCYDNLSDPFLLPDMDKATSRIKQAIQNHDKILIYGDYDVDGITASALMEEALILSGAAPGNISIMLPDRFTDGYGMSPKLIKFAQSQGIKLVITVDCGSRNHDIITELNNLGVDSIITDHHETDTTLPSAAAVINPKRKDCPTISLKNIAGVGVAFKLAQALVQANLIKNGQEKWLLDLVLIGTICDNMTLTGENRIFGYFGIKVLEKTRRPGLAELMRRARVKNLNAESIGFQIGPRLNAAGRLESADIALNLLRARSAIEAAPLAEKLEQLNKKRKTEQISATREIIARGVSDDPVIIAAGNWHEGILGIVAGRLVEEYHRPSFVLSEVEDGTLKGSGRSFGDFNLAEALNYAKTAIIGGGGHAGAAGVRLDKSRLHDFCAKINEYYKSLHLIEQEKYLRIHADLDVDTFTNFSFNFLNELKTLEPFGAGNEEPVFRLKNVNILNVTRMGADRNHLRLDIKDQSNKPLKLVAFFAPESWLSLDSASKIEPIIKLTTNDFNGVKSVEARLLDIGIIN